MVTSYRQRPATAPVPPKEATPEYFDVPTHVFVSGATVTAVRGEVRVETLRAGDRLRTRDGRHVLVEKVAIITKLQGSYSFMDALRPITIRRGTLGAGTPSRHTPVTRHQSVIGGAPGTTLEQIAKDMGGRITTATLGELAPKLIAITCEEPVHVGSAGIWLGAHPMAAQLRGQARSIAA
ncbi:MAG: Hint domain-containing protein [Pseudomonadota bacterium]